MEQRLTALIHQSLNQQSNLPTIGTVRNLIDAQTNHILARLDEQKTTNHILARPDEQKS